MATVLHVSAVAGDDPRVQRLIERALVSLTGVVGDISPGLSGVMRHAAGVAIVYADEVDMAALPGPQSVPGAGAHLDAIIRIVPRSRDVGRVGPGFGAVLGVDECGRRLRTTVRRVLVTAVLARGHEWIGSAPLLNEAGSILREMMAEGQTFGSFDELLLYVGLGHSAGYAAWDRAIRWRTGLGPGEVLRRVRFLRALGAKSDRVSWNAAARRQGTTSNALARHAHEAYGLKLGEVDGKAGVLPLIDFAERVLVPLGCEREVLGLRTK